MRGRVLVERRFEVLTTLVLLAVAFLVVVFATMVALKAANPVTFHFNLLLDILPWVTPTVIVLVLVGPLYLRVAAILHAAPSWPAALAAERFRLLTGSAFGLLGYTVVVWLGMVALRAWDPVDFHYNFVVDWLPVILPPWFAWLVGGPIAFRILGVMGATGAPRAQHLTRRWGASTLALLGAAFLSGGGLLLNQGVYAGTEGSGPLAGHALVAFGTLLLTAGGLLWAAFLATLAGGLTSQTVAALRVSPLDRFRLARPRLVVESFVWVNGLVAVIGLMMVALQYVDAQDFHWYFAVDLWLLAGPIVFSWIVAATLAFLVPARLAVSSPARWGRGALAATGPTGPSGSDRWGYTETPGRGGAVSAGPDATRPASEE
ncbi:MAG TPA: hypothetical protein VMW47_08815 [Verrucomicrobiae bacterium]|nr:hypothetical protein [Verrucomicrobiae bacterium]